MLNITVRLPSKRRFIIWSVCIIAVILIAGFVMQGGALRGEYDSYGAQVRYAKSLGWEISEKPVSEQKITIADRFDSNMELYNEIQISQGFDLRDFKGCEAVRYTYKLLNYPNYPDGVHLSFIVYNGDIIAGDIQSTTDSGFMHGIKL